MNCTVENDKKYIAQTYARFPVEIVSGKGSVFRDGEGKEYIDLGAGIAVNTFGICDSNWTAAVTEQLNAFQHTSNLYYSAPDTVLAKKLCERTGMKKVFFSNSGAEANECAIKAARKYACEKKGEEYYKIITLQNSFHGRTLTTLAATGQETFHSMFLPLTPGFLSVPANDAEALKNAVKENKCAAIMFEIVQGEGGVNPLDVSFLEAIQSIARQEDILMIADEVQCGNGRSGKLYAYMNYAITPDIVTTAKGIGGGLPIGITMLGEKVKDVFTPGTNGSTFGGNPVCCAGAVNILSRIDESVLNGVKERSELIFKTLTGKKGIVSVTGLGLMIGILTEKPAKEILAKCLENGVAVLTAKNKIRLLPALNIPIAELKKALDVIVNVCAQA